MVDWAQNTELLTFSLFCSDGCAGALEAPMADLTVGPRAQNLAHPDPVVTAGAVQFPTRPDPVVTAGTTQFPPPVFSDPVVSGGAAQLPPAHSDPVPPQPTTQFPHPVSAQPPGPSPMFPVMQQGVAMPRPSAPRPFRAPANVSEGECCVNHLAYHFYISPQPPSPPQLPRPTHPPLSLPLSLSQNSFCL